VKRTKAPPARRFLLELAGRVAETSASLNWQVEAGTFEITATTRELGEDWPSWYAGYILEQLAARE